MRATSVFQTMLRVLGLVAVAAMALLGTAPERAAAQEEAATPAALPAAPPLYVVIPFGEPGDTDAVLLQDTEAFTQDLSDRRIRTATSVPADEVEAVSNARAICTQYAAAGVLISQMRFSQTKNFSVTEFAVGFVPWVGGVIAGAGVLDRTPIYARYKLFLVDCRGKVVWRTITTANKIHHGTNIAAGLTEISDKAIAEAVEQFAARRAQAR